jgi:hypothetical protein
MPFALDTATYVELELVVICHVDIVAYTLLHATQGWQAKRVVRLDAVFLDVFVFPNISSASKILRDATIRVDNHQCLDLLGVVSLRMSWVSKANEVPPQNCPNKNRELLPSGFWRFRTRWAVVQEHTYCCSWEALRMPSWSLVPAKYLYRLFKFSKKARCGAKSFATSTNVRRLTSAAYYFPVIYSPQPQPQPQPSRPSLCHRWKRTTTTRITCLMFSLSFLSRQRSQIMHQMSRTAR